jgi:cytochrome c-type biogenesis protein CcmH/NrfF
MDKDPANVLPIDIMFDIQDMVKKGYSEEEILKTYVKKNLDQYIVAYITRIKDRIPIVFPN